MSDYIFVTDLGKKLSQTSKVKNDKEKRKKSCLQSHTPCLENQSVKGEKNYCTKIFYFGGNASK